MSFHACTGTPSANVGVDRRGRVGGVLNFFKAVRNGYRAANFL